MAKSLLFLSTCTLFLTFASSIVYAANEVPLHLRGVPRSLYSVYEGKDKRFTCLDKKGSITIGQINDDFCDCADGSDEPGTSACTNGKFYCINKGYRGKYLPSMYVNDGVCDCCDGSDEYNNNRGVTCPNTCEADGAAWREAQSEQIKRTEEGARKRLSYSTEGLEAAKVRKSKISDLAKRAEKARMEREVAEKEVADIETKEKSETEAQKAAAVSNGDSMIAEALGLGGLDKAGLLKLFLDHVKASDSSEKLIELIKERINANNLPGITSSFEPKWIENPQDIPEVKSDSGNAARERLTTAKAEESKVTSELSTLKEEENTDYGTDYAYWKLKNNCYDLKVTQYNYHICPFGRATQDGTHLGTFSGWKKDTNNLSVMLFTGGTTCWNGPARSLSVTFECGLEDKVTAFDEPEKCTYAARMVTPAACDDRAARELRLELETPGENARDEL